MTILIFGASGQDARILSEVYSKTSARVFLVSHSLNIDGYFYSDYSFISIKKILTKTKPDYIYFTAAQSSVSKSQQDHGSTLATNINIITNFFEAFIQTDLNSKIAFFNSSEIYGQSINKIPHSEKSMHNPSSPYALSKIIGSQIIDYYSSKFKINIIESIFFNHESIFRTGDYFVIKAVRELGRVKEGTLNNVSFGNLNVYRDFGCAINYMQILIELMESNFTGRVNICSGKAICLDQIVRFICDYYSLDYDKVIISDRSLFRSDDPNFIIGDNELLQSLISKNKINSNFFSVLTNILDSFQSE